MLVLCVNLNRQNSLEGEPYTSFLKKYDVIKESPYGEQIELRVGGKAGSFSGGFYIDDTYFKNPRFKLDFAQIQNPDDPTKTSTFIRATYSYESEDNYDLDIHRQRVCDIKKRAGYYYLPGVSHFGFSSQIDDDYKMYFDAIVDDGASIPDVCCQLISLVIAIFSLDN